MQNWNKISGQKTIHEKLEKIFSDYDHNKNETMEKSEFLDLLHALNYNDATEEDATKAMEGLN